MHNVNPSVRAVTFSVPEAVRITLIPQRRVHDLIDHKVLTPAIIGRRGANCGHRLSPQQLYALAAVGALYRSIRGCSYDYARAVMTIYEKMDDAALEEHRGGASVGAQTDDYTEEAISSWLDEARAGIFGDNGNPVLPSDQKVVEDMVRRFARVDEAIRIRKQGPKPKSNRVSDILSR